MVRRLLGPHGQRKGVGLFRLLSTGTFSDSIGNRADKTLEDAVLLVGLESFLSGDGYVGVGLFLERDGSFELALPCFLIQFGQKPLRTVAGSSVIFMQSLLRELTIFDGGAQSLM